MPGNGCEFLRTVYGENGMILQRMKYFVAVAECKIFTEAAERCYISQSAVSQQIGGAGRRIESEIISARRQKIRTDASGGIFL